MSWATTHYVGNLGLSKINISDILSDLSLRKQHDLDIIIYSKKLVKRVFGVTSMKWVNTSRQRIIGLDYPPKTPTPTLDRQDPQLPNTLRKVRCLQ